MASKDFSDLINLLFDEKRRIDNVTINFDGDGTEKVTISFIGSKDTLSSKDVDVVEYARRLRQTVDSDGNYEIVAYKDIQQYYKDVDFLFASSQFKIKQAYDNLIEARYTFDYDPDLLVEEFLLSTNRKSRKFLKLKSENFYIAAHCLKESKHALEQYEEMKAKRPVFESYHLLIEKVYMSAFRSSPNFVKNYSNYSGGF